MKKLLMIIPILMMYSCSNSIPSESIVMGIKKGNDGMCMITIKGKLNRGGHVSHEIDYCYCASYNIGDTIKLK